MKKILLINPPAHENVDMIREGRCMQRVGAWATNFPPLTLCTIGTIAQKLNWQVKVIDSITEKISFDKLRAIIVKEKPDVVLFNTATPSINSDLKVANIAKKNNKNVTTIAIGTHVSNLPDEALKENPDLDLVIRNEVEETIKEILKEKNLENVKGISYRKGKQIIHNKERQYIDNLDELEEPNWELVNVNKYRLPNNNKPFLLLNVARGCYYNCIYCVAKEYHGQKLRQRNIKSIANEIKKNTEKFKINHFLIWHESFTLDNNFVREFCNEIIKQKIRIKWICNSRTNDVDIQTLKLMKKAGCFLIGFGIESGDQETLNYIKKGTKIEDSIKAVKLTKKAGIDTVGHFVMGLPNESEEKIMKTIKLAKRLDLDFAQFYCATPWPGTELYEKTRKNKQITTNDWKYYEQNFAIIKTDKITPEQVTKLRKKAYTEFYLRPKMIIRHIIKIKSFSELKGYLIATKNFLSWM